MTLNLFFIFFFFTFPAYFLSLTFSLKFSKNQIYIYKFSISFFFPFQLCFSWWEPNKIYFYTFFPCPPKRRVKGQYNFSHNFLFYCLSHHPFWKKILSYHFSKVITWVNMSNYYLNFLFIKLSYENCSMFLVTFNKNLVTDNFLI